MRFGDFSLEEHINGVQMNMKAVGSPEKIKSVNENQMVQEKG